MFEVSHFSDMRQAGEQQVSDLGPDTVRLSVLVSGFWLLVFGLSGLGLGWSPVDTPSSLPESAPSGLRVDCAFGSMGNQKQ